MKNSSIRVLYDHEGLDAAYSGVACYFQEIIKNLPADVEVRYGLSETANPELTMPPYNIPMSRHTFRNFLPQVNFFGKRTLYNLLGYRLKLFPLCEEINRQCFRQNLMQDEFDLVHLTGAHSYGADWKLIANKKPIVITVHDLIPEILRNDVVVEHERKEMLASVSHALCVSECTRRDLCAHYQFPVERTTVVYHGAIEPRVQKACRAVAGVKYILYVGKRGDYKHSDWFFEAIAPFLKRHHEMSLVCTGRGFKSSEVRQLKELGIYRQVIQLFVPNDELISLYAHADLFVYPSIYEGFGIPILDAFSAGCPVLLSRASCFPEVGGEAAMYFDPYSKDDFLSCVNKIIEDPVVRQRMVVNGIARVKAFTWRKAADQTADIYRRVVEEWHEK